MVLIGYYLKEGKACHYYCLSIGNIICIKCLFALLLIYIQRKNIWFKIYQIDIVQTNWNIYKQENQLHNSGRYTVLVKPLNYDVKIQNQIYIIQPNLSFKITDGKSTIKINVPYPKFGISINVAWILLISLNSKSLLSLTHWVKLQNKY